MAKEYFLSQMDIEWSYNRWLYKGGTGEYPKMPRNNKIGLWDRNMGKFIWFEIIKKCDEKYGYIVRRKGNVSLYWKKTFKKNRLKK